MSDEIKKMELELKKTKMGYRQAIIIAIIGALVSIVTVYKDVIYQKDTTEKVNEVAQNLPIEVSKKIDDKIKTTNGNLMIESVPLGTVISSSLNYEDFSKVTNNGEVFNPQKSLWAPADGRLVASSKFHILTQNSTLPDLRGQFIRGYNQFLLDGEPNEIINGGDPNSEERNLVNGYSYQKDLFQKHEHEYYAGTQNYTEKGTGNMPYLIRPDWKETRSNTGGKETRPKNIALYYYIKIN